ncbi:hypothetical protein [Streptomyces violascens]|uniref:hypothetical protein n=1 Tax=Streptomyces violascens TaxID=67381 RepID=UPI003664EA24
MPEIERALPTVNDVPPGWEQRGKADLLDERGKQTNGGRLGLAEIHYRAADLDGIVTFAISSYPDSETAHTDLGQFRSSGDDLPSSQIGSADEGTASHGCFSTTLCEAIIQLRAGAAVIHVSITTDGPTAPDPRLLNSAVRMAVERVRQTQRGDTPTAKTA